MYYTGDPHTHNMSHNDQGNTSTRVAFMGHSRFGGGAATAAAAAAAATVASAVASAAEAAPATGATAAVLPAAQRCSEWVQTQCGYSISV
jgi:hypothetical protein